MNRFDVSIIRRNILDIQGHQAVGIAGFEECALPQTVPASLVAGGFRSDASILNHAPAEAGMALRQT